MNCRPNDLARVVAPGRLTRCPFCSTEAVAVLPDTFVRVTHTTASPGCSRNRSAAQWTSPAASRSTSRAGRSSTRCCGRSATRRRCDRPDGEDRRPGAPDRHRDPAARGDLVMSRLLVVTPELAAGAPVGLALVSGAALMQRHADASLPGFWSVRRFEPNNHRKTATAHATVDDFGNLIEVTQ